MQNLCTSTKHATFIIHHPKHPAHHPTNFPWIPITTFTAKGDGHNFPVQRRKLPELVAPMSSVPWWHKINERWISMGKQHQYFDNILRWRRVYKFIIYIYIYIYVMCYMKSLLLDIHVQVCSVYNMYWNIDIHTLCDDYISNHHSTLQDMWSSPLHFLEDWRCLSIFEVRFVVKPGTTLELLAGARPPKQFAARTAGVLSWC